METPVMLYRHSNRHNRLSARRDDILGKDELTIADHIELTRLAIKIAALPEAENYRRYLINRMKCSDKLKNFMRANQS